jgi:nucleotide-binding universal stress UspA family protein
MAEPTRMIVMPVDGSENALRSLDYVRLIYSPTEQLELVIFYVLHSLPRLLTEDETADAETAQKLKLIETKNLRMAERILVEAKGALMGKGFSENQIRTVYRKKETGIAQDICRWAEGKQADAVLITTRGRSRLEAFLMGEISSKLLDYCRVCPVWIVEGAVTSNRVLVAVDSSENALRAVDHAGFMLAGTACQVTIFHSMRQLQAFVPLEIYETAPELEERWRQKTSERIGPHIDKAREVLLKAGLKEQQITTRVVEGSGSAASDILQEARASGCGSVVLGRRGLTGLKEFIMGSVTAKVLQASTGLAVWIVQ